MNNIDEAAFFGKSVEAEYRKKIASSTDHCFFFLNLPRQNTLKHSSIDGTIYFSKPA